MVVHSWVFSKKTSDNLLFTRFAFSSHCSYSHLRSISRDVFTSFSRKYTGDLLTKLLPHDWREQQLFNSIRILYSVQVHTTNAHSTKTVDHTILMFLCTYVHCTSTDLLCCANIFHLCIIAIARLCSLSPKFVFYLQSFMVLISKTSWNQVNMLFVNF